MDLKKTCLNCFELKGDYEVCPFCGWVENTIPVQAYHLYPGTILQSRYIIGIVLGFGGFGVTYKSFDTKLNEVVAIKEFYHTGLLIRVPGDNNIVVFSGEKQEQYQIFLNRFLEEARIMAKFNNHPNIVRVFDFFEENFTAYIVMEYLGTRNLADYLIEQNGKLDIPESLEITSMLMEAISTIHSKGVIHRDIQPHNIMITKDHKVKLLDLGAAKLSDIEEEKTLSAVITPGYASPEQYRTKSKQGPWTDIYGLGAILYKMVTGVAPYESVDRQVFDNLKHPKELNEDVSIQLDKAIMKSISIKYELRFQNIEQFRDALFNNSNIEYPEDELRKKKKLRFITIGIASILFAILFISTLLFNTIFAPEYKLSSISILEDEISIWIPVEDIDNLASNEIKIYEKIKEQFNKTNDINKLIKINLTYINKKDYSKKLMEASKNKKLPTIFASDYFNTTELNENSIELKKLVSSINSEECLFLNDYNKYFSNKKEFPTGFESTVLYANNNIATENNVSLTQVFDSFQKLIDVSKEKPAFTININNYDDFLLLYSNETNTDLKIDENMKANIISLGESFASQNVTKKLPIEQFENDEVMFLVGDTSIYRKVQESLPGYYSIIPLTNKGEIFITLTGLWSVNKNSTENQQNSAMLFLSFLLTDYSQNIMYIQNDGALPINKVSFNMYTKINSELSFLETLVTKVKLTGQDTLFYNNFSNDLYKDVIEKNLKKEEINQYLENKNVIGAIK